MRSETLSYTVDKLTSHLEHFLTGSNVWVPEIANDVDIAFKISARPVVEERLKDLNIDFEDGVYHNSLKTLEVFHRSDGKILSINALFLNNEMFEKWQFVTKLMHHVQVPHNREQRHAVFETLCGVAGICGFRYKEVTPTF